jgi:hypothetical protein
MVLKMSSRKMGAQHPRAQYLYSLFSKPHSLRAPRIDFIASHRISNGEKTVVYLSLEARADACFLQIRNKRRFFLAAYQNSEDLSL